MYVATSKQMADVDRFLIDNKGYTIIELVEMASLKLYPYTKDFQDILLLVGPGNNGADALSLAKRLLQDGKKVSIYFYHVDHANDTLLYYYKQIIDLIQHVEIIEGHYDLIVDGLFGNGLDRPIELPLQEVLVQVNALNSYKLAIDIPTGIQGVNKLQGNVFIADETITFMALKPAMLNQDLESYFGEIYVEEFGIEKEALNIVGASQLFSYKEAIKQINKRSHYDHKGIYGRVTHLTGSNNYVGASCLAAKASVYTGSGIVRVVSDQEVLQEVCHQCMEVITHPFIQSPIIFEKQSAILCGCGKGWNEETKQLVEYLLEYSEVPIVFDADAINCISENPDILLKKKCPVILTPHLGEFERLCPNSTNIHEEAKYFSDKYDVIMVIKGANTFIYYQSEYYQNASGNPSMATAGMGDVLAGIICSLCGQNYTPFKAALLGVFIHGYAGDYLSETCYTSVPEKLIELIPIVMKELCDEKDFNRDNESL